MKQKIALWQQTLKMGLVHTFENHPMCTMKYTAVYLILWAYFSARHPGHMVQMDGIMNCIKYLHIKFKTGYPC